MKSLSKFGLSVSIAAVVLNLIVLAFTALKVISPVVTIALLSVVAGFAVISLFLYRFILKANAKSPQRFVSSFTAGVGVKLFACILFLGGYLFFKGESPVLVAMSTFGTYLVFNIILIRFLIKAVRPS